MDRFTRLANALSVVALVAALAACGTVAGPTQSELPMSDEPLLGKFVWHDLITDDTDAARRFYAGLLGWEFEETVRPNGGAYVLIKSGGRYIGGMLELEDPGGGQDYSRWLGYLSVADVDAAAAATRQAGGEVVAAPRDIGNIARAAAVTDPQGAVVGLVRAHAGDPGDDLRRQPGHVVWNELLAADDRAAAAFYAELTGMEVVAEARRGGEYLMLQQNGLNRAGVMRRPVDDIKPLWLTHFAVADPGAAIGDVAALGGDVLLAPSPDLRDGSMALVTDPGGAVLALWRWTP